MDYRGLGCEADISTNIMKIFALGVMYIEYDHRSKDDHPTFHWKRDRLCHLYSNFEDAEQHVLNNYGDLFEYYYNIALIEEVFVLGKDTDNVPYDGRERRWWYLAEYTPDEKAPFGCKGPFISKIECPLFFKNIVNFWVG